MHVFFTNRTLSTEVSLDHRNRRICQIQMHVLTAYTNHIGAVARTHVLRLLYQSTLQHVFATSYNRLLEAAPSLHWPRHMHTTRQHTSMQEVLPPTTTVLYTAWCEAYTNADQLLIQVYYCSSTDDCSLVWQTATVRYTVHDSNCTCWAYCQPAASHRTHIARCLTT
jgi:hypothetical protein